MAKNWFVETHGDPLGVIQKIIATAWDNFDLDQMMVSSNGVPGPHLIEDVEQLEQINPFRPLMTQNSAKYIPEILEKYPQSRLGAVLRPCEMRALKERSKREAIPTERLLTICVDCLGTYPEEDYQWRAERKGSPERLAWESLHFARQGGIAAYRYRPACQVCRSPVGSEADINLGVLGLPVRKKIMLRTSRQVDTSLIEGKGIRLHADQRMLEQRERIITKLLQRGSHTRERLARNLDSILPRDVDALIDQFESCGECRQCFDKCPLCAADYPAKNEAGRYRREQVKEWLISCAGCGMCEQACPNHLPLVTIFGQIRESLIESLEPIH
jgi:formate dehydrogenase subunit beta